MALLPVAGVASHDKKLDGYVCFMSMLVVQSESVNLQVIQEVA